MLRRAADGGRRVASIMFVPHALAGLACMAAIAGDDSTAAAAVGEARAELGGRRQAITAAALRYAEGIMAWHRGGLADAEHLAREATVAWHRCGDRMDGCDGIELLGVLAAALSTEDDPTPPRRAKLHATDQVTGMAVKPRRVGDLAHICSRGKAIVLTLRG